MRRITIDEALDVALCFGWIDGHRKRGDDDYFLQRYSPRSPKSPWSLKNVERVEALVSRGLFEPSGYEQIERAQADGRWAIAYASQNVAAVPDELADLLATSDEAKATFAKLGKTDRYLAILPILKAATRHERQTRAARAFRLIAEH